MERHNVKPPVKSERRDTPRVPVVLEAMLSHDERGFQRFTTRDLSLDGVFIETGPIRLGRKNVELALKLPADGRSRIHRFQAQVARVTPAGTALAFEKVDTEGYAALMDLVFSRQPKGAY